MTSQEKRLMCGMGYAFFALFGIVPAIAIGSLFGMFAAGFCTMGAIMMLGDYWANRESG